LLPDRAHRKGLSNHGVTAYSELKDGTVSGLNPNAACPLAAGRRFGLTTATKHRNFQAGGTACLGIYHTKANLCEAPERQPVALVVSMA
jgi:hypothetical protein